MLQHPWNCTALSIIYSFSFAYCFQRLRGSGFCCPWYQVLLHLTRSSNTSPLLAHSLTLAWGAMDFFPLPFTQWQRAEVLWGLGANELTLQRWGRCSVTQGRGVRGQCDQGRSGLEAESRPRCQAETSASKVVLSAKVGLLFNMSLNIW